MCHQNSEQLVSYIKKELIQKSPKRSMKNIGIVFSYQYTNALFCSVKDHEELNHLEWKK